VVSLGAPTATGSFGVFSRSFAAYWLFLMAKSSETDGFSEETKRKLADRAGHHCSLCLALTTCSDAEGKPFRIGDAAHQAAASEGGPRQTQIKVTQNVRQWRTVYGFAVRVTARSTAINTGIRFRI
jgi:hypothetical protein